MDVNKPSRRTISLIFVISVVLISATLYFSLPISTPLEGIQVAIYTDHGIRASSRIALEHMFLWMGAEVTIIGATEIANGFLDTCDILVMPGGCWCDERCDILDDKMEIVRQFVMDGGAYFGIDGGASYATRYRLNLFHGKLYPDSNGTGNYLLRINVNKLANGPNLTDEPDSYEILYESSGYFNSEDMSNIIPICTYTDTGFPCMIAFKYANGTVFLSSPHPEYEEGNSRDGTDVFDTLNDSDSEWDLMLKICLWQLGQ